MPPSASSSITPEPATQATGTPKHTFAKPSLSSSLKRKLHAFVEIPPSPLHSVKKNNRKASRTQSSKSSGMNQPPLSPKNINRRPFVDLLRSSDSPAKKKPRLSNVEVVITRAYPEKIQSSHPQTHKHLGGLQTKDAARRLRCHQCGQPRDQDDLACCSKSTCSARYCGLCLRNRYAQTVGHIKQCGISSDPQVIAAHTVAEGYIWDCFRCRRVCNCSKCRKSQGLEPLGKDKALRFTRPLTAITMAVKSTQVKRSIDNPAKADAAKPKVSVPRKRKVKAVPSPKWIPVPGEFSYREVEDRIFIREFFLRFEQLMDITLTRLDELDEFDSLSFTLAKALLLNILNLIAADVDDEPKRLIKNAVAAIKQAHSSRQIPASLWAPLESLRTSLASTSYPLSVPEPAPPSSRASSRSQSPPAPTRTLPPRASRPNHMDPLEFYSKAASTEPSKHDIVDPEQLIPVLVALAQAALQLPSCREEIENGVNDLKEENKRYWAAMKVENERWSAESKALTEEKENGATTVENEFSLDAWTTKYKTAQSAHKQTVSLTENEHAVKSQAWQPRFTPLGKDAHGRVYFAGTAFAKNKSSRTLEDVGELKKWGWFIAVWGEAPSSFLAIDKRRDGSQPGEKGVGWWGFHDPAEIRKLAKWIGATAGEDLPTTGAKDDKTSDAHVVRNDNDHEDSVDEEQRAMVQRKEHVERRRLPAIKEIAELVKSLNSYANVLESRFSKDNNKK